MISWLLFKRSIQQSFGRLALTAGAIALGIIMVLAFGSGINALESRGNHSDWRYQIFSENSQKPKAGISPLLAMTSSAGNLNKWHNQNIWMVSVRPTGANSPQIPGLATPKAGEYYVSPALEKVVRKHPQDDIGSRFGTKYMGTIPDSLISSPDSLDVIRGLTDQELQTKVQPRPVYTIRANEKGVSKYSGGTGMILVVGAAIILFPIVQFIVISTQLGSVQREKRYAALRLVGATKYQVTRIIALESLMAALAGIAVGTDLYLLIAKDLIAQFYFDGMRFWPSDIGVTVYQYLLIVVLTIGLSLLANWWGMRHVQSSPLGMMRSQRLEKRPWMWRVLLLVAGLGVFGWLATFGKSWASVNSSKSMLPLLVIMVGIFAIMFGLVIGGSWVTYTVTRLFAKFAKKPKTLLATKRINVHSRQIFRSVSGVVLALFAGSFYLTATGGMERFSAQAVDANGYSRIKPGYALITSDVPFGDNFESKLRDESYIVSTLKLNVEMTENSTTHYVPCSELSVYTKLSCPSGHQNEVALIDFENLNGESIRTMSTLTAVSESSAAYLVKMDSKDSLDRLRTFTARETANFMNPTYVVSGDYAQEPILNPIMREFASLAYIGIGVTMLIAAVSLIVSTLGGILERQRSLATLRLQGMLVSDLKKVVMIESLVPLLLTAVIAGGIGIWVGVVFINVLSSGLRPEVTPLYWMITLGCLAIAVLGIWLVLPTISRITHLSANRTE